ncbi:hypothetical protein BDZ89DRAFT_1058723, partial [Hymenopellis radicata]
PTGDEQATTNEEQATTNEERPSHDERGITKLRRTRNIRPRGQLSHGKRGTSELRRTMNDWATTDEERPKGCAAQGITEPRCTRNKEPLSCDERGATKTTAGPTLQNDGDEGTANERRATRNAPSTGRSDGRMTFGGQRCLRHH